MAHVTALAVNAANKIPAIKKWKQNVTNIVGHFKHSSQSLQSLLELLKEKGKPELRPIQEGATRWTSTFAMLDRFMTLYDEIQQLGNTNFIEPIQKNLPTNQHQLEEMKTVVQVYRDLLKPFKDITAVCQGSKHPTLPAVAKFLIPIACSKIGNHLEVTPDDGKLQEDVKHKMLNKFLDYYGDEELGLLYAGAYCDPLINSKLKQLGASQEVIDEGMKLIKSRLQFYIAKDKVAAAVQNEEQP
jgi:hypothetical protein